MEKKGTKSEVCAIEGKRERMELLFFGMRAGGKGEKKHALASPTGKKGGAICELLLKGKEEKKSSMKERHPAEEMVDCLHRGRGGKKGGGGCQGISRKKKKEGGGR